MSDCAVDSIVAESITGRASGKLGKAMDARDSVAVKALSSRDRGTEISSTESTPTIQLALSAVEKAAVLAQGGTASHSLDHDSKEPVAALLAIVTNEC